MSTLPVTKAVFPVRSGIVVKLNDVLLASRGRVKGRIPRMGAKDWTLQVK